MISAVTLPNGSALEVFAGRDLQNFPSLDGPLCKPRDSERADVGSALTQKNNKITFIHAGVAWHPSPAAFPSGDDGLMCANPFHLEDLPMFQLLKLTGEGKRVRK